jgi:hypothetical protein
MIRLLNIVEIKVEPKETMARQLTVRCLSGRAKWSADSRVLSLKVDIIDDEAEGQWVTFLASNPQSFDLEVTSQSGIALEDTSTSRFNNCIKTSFECRSGTARPRSPSTTSYYLKATAECGAQQ